MNSQTRSEIRSGLIALAVSGLLFTLGIVLRGAVDLADPTSFIQAAASPYYIPGWTMILIGGVLWALSLSHLSSRKLTRPSRISSENRGTCPRSATIYISYHQCACDC